MKWVVPLAGVELTESAIEAVERVMRSGWLSMGPVTEEFEQAFARFLEVPHALAVASCTAALHLACAALELGPGDEVLVPSLTFVATANAIAYTGATPVFVDIESDSDLTLSPEDCSRKITERTKAIMVMHYGGYACDMDKLLTLARHSNLRLIEDAAHAPGATYRSQLCGTMGDLGCFSFFSNKNLATGEGGMVVTGRADIAEKIKLLRSHGMTTLTWDRHRGHASTYDVVELGYNYRIDEIRSALGLVQLGKLPQGNARRRDLTGRYWRRLAGAAFRGIELPFVGARGESSNHILPVLLPEDASRQAFMDAMREAGIQTSIHYPPVHQFSYYRGRYPGLSLPVTERLGAREVTLPLYPTMSDEQVDMVLTAAAIALAIARAENNA